MPGLNKKIPNFIPYEYTHNHKIQKKKRYFKAELFIYLVDLRVLMVLLNSATFALLETPTNCKRLSAAANLRFIRLLPEGGNQKCRSVSKNISASFHNRQQFGLCSIL